MFKLISFIAPLAWYNGASLPIIVINAAVPLYRLVCRSRFTSRVVLYYCFTHCRQRKMFDWHPRHQSLNKKYMFIKNIKFVIQEIIFVYKMFVVYMIYMSLYIQIESLSIFYTCYCFFLNIKRFVKILILCTIIDDL